MLDYMIMPFRRYAEFSGRSRRMEYWAFTLLNFIVASVLLGLAISSGLSYRSLVASGTLDSGLGVAAISFLVILGLYLLVALLPGIAVTVRRLHDRNMSGWWYLVFIVLSMLPLIGFIASIALLVIFFLPGTPGPNRFGEDPKDPTGAEVFA